MAAIPVIDLPDDVIIEVLALVSEDEDRRNYDTFMLFPHRLSRRGLIACSHVCRRWRDIALACASLWTSIDIADWCYGKVEEFIRRSSGAYLAVQLAVPASKRQIKTGHDNPDGTLQNTDETRASIDLWLQHIHRTRCLSIVEGAEDLSTINTMGSIEAPALECLKIDASNGFHTQEIIGNIEGCLVKKAPLLRDLRLCGVRILGDSHIFDNLTSLHLRYVVISGGCSVIDLLVRSRRLVELVLDTIRSRPRLDEIINGVCLPSLARLVVRGHAWFCTRMMELLEIPARTCPSLVCTTCDDEFTAMSVPSFALGEYIRAFVLIATFSHSTMEIQSPSQDSKSMSEGLPVLSLTKRKTYLEAWRTHWAFDQLIAKLDLAVVPTKSLDLYIRGPRYPHGSTAWGFLFRRLQQLESLTIHLETRSVTPVFIKDDSKEKKRKMFRRSSENLNSAP